MCLYRIVVGVRSPSPPERYLQGFGATAESSILLDESSYEPCPHVVAAAVPGLGAIVPPFKLGEARGGTHRSSIKSPAVTSGDEGKKARAESRRKSSNENAASVWGAAVAAASNPVYYQSPHHQNNTGNNYSQASLLLRSSSVEDAALRRSTIFFRLRSWTRQEVKGNCYIARVGYVFALWHVLDITRP